MTPPPDYIAYTWTPVLRTVLMCEQIDTTLIAESTINNPEHSANTLLITQNSARSSVRCVRSQVSPEDQVPQISLLD